MGKATAWGPRWRALNLVLTVEVKETSREGFLMEVAPTLRSEGMSKSVLH